MYSLKQFDLTIYNNWDSNLEDIESYDVFYDNKQVAKENLLLAVFVNKKTKFIAPVIKVISTTFSYNSVMTSSNYRIITNCSIYGSAENIDSFNNIIYSDEFIDFLKENYPNALSYYNVNKDTDNIEILNTIAKNKNFVRNKEVEYERVYELILNDFRNIKLGRITLDR